MRELLIIRPVFLLLVGIKAEAKVVNYSKRPDPVKRKAQSREVGVSSLAFLVVLSMILLVVGFLTGHIPRTPEASAKRWLAVDAPAICRRLALLELSDPGEYEGKDPPRILGDDGKKRVLEVRYKGISGNRKIKAFQCTLDRSSRSVSLAKD